MRSPASPIAFIYEFWFCFEYVLIDLDIFERIRLNRIRSSIDLGWFRINIKPNSTKHENEHFLLEFDVRSEIK